MFFENAFGKQQINFFCPDLQTRSSHLLEYNSCDWMTCRSQVIMLTVESVRKKDDLKQQTKWQVVLFVSQQRPVETTNCTEDKWNIIWGFFIWGFISLFLPLLCFHFQLREKLELCVIMDSEVRGNHIRGLVFHLTAVVAGCWFHANQFECAHGLLVFCLSQNSLRLENFKDYHVNFSNYAAVIFSFPENWTSLPLMTYSQTDNKGFSCMIL